MQNNVPSWWKVLNAPADKFSRRTDGQKGFRFNTYDTLREIAPELYDGAAAEVKEFNEYHTLNGNSFGKVKLGRLIGSIPMRDWAMHPELAYDNKALKKYFEQHPELRAERYSKHGNLANGHGFSSKKEKR